MSEFTVSSASALTAALKLAQSGDTVELQAGTYSGVALSNLTFAGGVTITSADPNHEAVVTDLALTNVNGLTFSHLELAEAGPGYNISRSQNISFDHDYVHGSLDGNAQDDPNGLSFLDTSHVSITNSEFTQLKTAIGIGANTLKQITDITVSGNDIHGLEKAGVIIAGASNVSISKNFISDIRPLAADHPDAIQFFTTGTTVAAQNIDISDNVIMRGDGDATQGIFLRDQVGTLPYHNVTIENNLVVGTGYAGIYAEGVNGVQISGNELVSDPGKTNNTWMLVQTGANVTSTGNTAQTISFDGVTNVRESGDLINTPVDDGGQLAIDSWAMTHVVDPAALVLAATVAFELHPVITAAEPQAMAVMPIVAGNMWGGGFDF
jgi:parallel beta-helix repeat protein